MGACSSLSGNSSVSQQETIPLGQVVYLKNCASCHGPNGEGQNPAAPLSKDATGRFLAPPHDSTGHTWHHDDDLLIQIVREGGMGSPSDFYPMPAFGDKLSDEDITAVIAYIQTLWTEEQRTRQRQATEAVSAQK
ncbi:MAG: cytochrome c [Anaerolineae bacterium]|nr:cytochrome c [Anaerolineae bacterium]